MEVLKIHSIFCPSIDKRRKILRGDYTCFFRLDSFRNNHFTEGIGLKEYSECISWQLFREMIFRRFDCMGSSFKLTASIYLCWLTQLKSQHIGRNFNPNFFIIPIFSIQSSRARRALNNIPALIDEHSRRECSQGSMIIMPSTQLIHLSFDLALGEVM